MVWDGRPLAGVGGNIDPNEIEGPVRLGLFDAGSALHGNPDALVGAGDGPVDELGSLNEQPDHSARQIGDYYREALLLKLLDQAAHATVNLPGGLHWVGLRHPRARSS